MIYQTMYRAPFSEYSKNTVQLVASPLNALGVNSRRLIYSKLGTK